MKSMDEDLFDLLGMKGSIISTPLTSTAKLDGVEVVWMNAYLDQRDFTLTINGDLSWAAASLLAVFAYMAIHTRSLMISVIGMAIVIFSFLLAVFAVKLVFQVGRSLCSSQSLHRTSSPLPSAPCPCRMRGRSSPSPSHSAVSRLGSVKPAGQVHGHDARAHNIRHARHWSG